MVWCLPEGREWRDSCRGYMVTEDDLTKGGGYTMQYTDHVS